MIRRLLPLLLLPVVLSPQFACSRSTETADGTTQAPKGGAAADPSKPEPATPDTVAQGEPQKVQPRVDPTQFPEVVARVGGNPISRSDLINAAQQVASQSAQARVQPPEPTLEFFHEILDGLIVRELLYLDAKTQGLTANEAEVKRRMDEMKKRFPDAKQFHDALSAQGFTEKEITDNARTTLTVDRLVAEKYAPAVKVAETDVRAYYDANPEQMKIEERRRLRHILIRPEGADPAAKEKAKKLAEEILSRIKKGEDFAQLASQYSADPGSKNNGGELPPMAKGMTAPEFDKAAWELPKGGLSGVIETEFGFHIIQMIDVVPASSVPYDQVHERVEQFLRQRDLKKAVRAHADELRAKTKVEILI